MSLGQNGQSNIIRTLTEKLKLMVISKNELARYVNPLGLMEILMSATLTEKGRNEEFWRKEA
jgi:hypothetical protein